MASSSALRLATASVPASAPSRRSDSGIRASRVTCTWYTGMPSALMRSMRTRCTTSTATTTTVGRRAEQLLEIERLRITDDRYAARLRRARRCARWCRPGSAPAPAAYNIAVVPGASDTMRHGAAPSVIVIARVVAHLPHEFVGAHGPRALPAGQRGPARLARSDSPRRVMRPDADVRGAAGATGARGARDARFQAIARASRRDADGARPRRRAPAARAGAGAPGMSFHALTAKAMTTMAATSICCAMACDLTPRPRRRDR